MKAPNQTAAAKWTGEAGYTRMMIRDFATEVRLGLHEWERHPEKPQRVVVNVEMFAASRSHLGEGGVVDYDYIHDALRAWPTREHVVWIETLLEELVALCFKDARVQACRVSIVKPDIYNAAAGAGVEIYRVRD